MQKAILLTSYGFVAQPGLPDEELRLVKIKLLVVKMS